MKKINCGGFYINEDNFEITDDGELKLKSGSGGASVVYCPLRSEGPYLYAEKTTSELAQADTIIFEQTAPAEYGGGTIYYPCVQWTMIPEAGGSFNILFLGEGETPRMITLSAGMDDYPTNDPQGGGGDVG